MNTRSIRALIRKDVSVITSSAQMWVPMLIIPLLFVVIMPAAFLILGRTVQFDQDKDNMEFIGRFLSGIPEGAVKSQLGGMPGLNAKLVYLLINYVFAPLFLIVPTMVSSIVAAASFVGEKEKKTLETLLFSPMSEMEMFTAKVLAAFLPSMAVSLVGFLIFCAEFMILGAPLFGRAMLPAPHWLPIVLLLVPALSLIVIFLNVLVSVKVKGFQEAQQVSVVVILPVLFLVYGQIGGIVFMSSLLVVIMSVVMLAIDALLIRLAAKVYNRDKLFATQVF